ncbi:bifunctional arginine demethylase and lysyl-hydroxylase JMJD6-like isoform X2 [Neocloeon triangulifer]|uniref:bifunctional arginine demethylase and lysyl-hydroxylase JMJD6-like isoform X2 n=1 Tax=Neocloeon triangulifer TaxID=2078957 RepID=UPI00286F4C8E|nr:bifunctional arginine demethylase and lysyl-hydroxylase JMJD6-like isoform X2 [Neocloeon triangulifer]
MRAIRFSAPTRVNACLLENPDWLQDTTRRPEDCSVCVGVDSVDRITKISPQHFEQTYASSGRPVVIEDAMRNWTAPSVISLDFLRRLYRDSPQPNCQFFPYKTEFRSLAEFLNMSEERATGKPWYVGWSNCDDRVSRQLRQHYSRPYFLPENSENRQLDWIFIGSPGYGAHMHVDNVGHVSWQAQLKGHKLWVLQPPPECLYRCSIMQTILKPGDIIVLDTDRWYHSTLIVSDDISITIGAEFD